MNQGLRQWNAGPTGSPSAHPEKQASRLIKSCHVILLLSPPDPVKDLGHARRGSFLALIEIDDFLLGINQAGLIVRCRRVVEADELNTEVVLEFTSQAVPERVA